MTGAAGRIGTALRAELRRGVAHLSCLDAQPIENLGKNEVGRQLDLGDLEGMTSAFDGMDGVIHLGGFPTEEDFHDIAQVNIVGTFHVFEAARRAGVSRVVLASTNHVTGFYPVDVRVDPDMPARPDTFYGVSKAAGEAIGRLYADKFGLRVACLRIGTYEDRPLERRHMSTWASPDDTVAAFKAAMNSPDLDFSIFYVVSSNRDNYWDMEAGKRVGFVPTDHAEDFKRDLGGAVYEFQGGPFTSVDYTESHLRPH